MSSCEILARVRAEKNNMIWYGGPIDAFVAANEERLIKPYKSPNSADINDKFKDPNRVLTGIYIGYLGFCC